MGDREAEAVVGGLSGGKLSLFAVQLFLINRGQTGRSPFSKKVVHNRSGPDLFLARLFPALPQMLGALGLFLGTAGLAAVLLRKSYESGPKITGITQESPTSKPAATSRLSP